MNRTDPESIRYLGIERLENRSLLSADGFSFDDLFDSRFESRGQSGTQIRFLASSPSAIRAQLQFRAHESIGRHSDDHDDRRDTSNRRDLRSELQSPASSNQRSGSATIALLNFSGSVHGSNVWLILSSGFGTDSDVSSPPTSAPPQASIPGSDPVDTPESGLTSNRVPSGESPPVFQTPDIGDEVINDPSPSDSAPEPVASSGELADVIINASRLVSLETPDASDAIDAILGADDFRAVDPLLIVGSENDGVAFDETFQRFDRVGVPHTNLEVWLRTSAERRELLFELEDLLDAIAEDPAIGQYQALPFNQADFGDQPPPAGTPSDAEPEMILLRPVEEAASNDISSLAPSASADPWDSGIGFYQTFEQLDEVPVPEIAQSIPEQITRSPAQPVDSSSSPTDPTGKTWQAGERMMGVVVCCLGIRYLRNRRQTPHQPK